LLSKSFLITHKKYLSKVFNLGNKSGGVTETEKTLVAKVVGNTKMHISTKNGTMVPQFTVEFAQTMVTWQGRPRKLLPGSTSL
jgi:hypothetical protein